MVITIEEAFGERIRQLRTLRGVSQDELGKKIHVEKSAISKYEKGRRGLSITTVIELAAALNCSPSWLLFGGVDDQIVKVGEREHPASDWWAWLAGTDPLPPADRRDFYRAVPVDQLSALDVLRRGRSTPALAGYNEAAAPASRALLEAERTILSLGYKSLDEAFSENPGWETMPLEDLIGSINEELS